MVFPCSKEREEEKKYMFDHINKLCILIKSGRWNTSFCQCKFLLDSFPRRGWMQCLWWINEPKFVRVMTFSPHKGICIGKMAYSKVYRPPCHVLIRTATKMIRYVLKPRPKAKTSNYRCRRDCRGSEGWVTVVICFVTDEKRKIYCYSFQSSSHAGHESGQTMLCQFRVATLDVKDCECITYKRTTQHVA